jgi:hypothetical protein
MISKLHEYLKPNRKKAGALFRRHLEKTLAGDLYRFVYVSNLEREKTRRHIEVIHALLFSKLAETVPR